MKLTCADLDKLQEAINQNKSWRPVQSEPNLDKLKAHQAEQLVTAKQTPKPPKRPPAFDEPGTILGEALDGVGLSFGGLEPVFLVRKGEYIDIAKIQDKLLLNPLQAKYKVVTAVGRFIIARSGRSWVLEKELIKQS